MITCEFWLSVLIRHASVVFFLRSSAALKTTSHDLFLQLKPLVPLYVPHLGHAFTPLSVLRPRSESKSFKRCSIESYSFDWSFARQTLRELRNKDDSRSKQIRQCCQERKLILGACPQNMLPISLKRYEKIFHGLNAVFIFKLSKFCIAKFR